MNLLKDLFVNPKAYAKFWVAFATFVLNVVATVFTGAVWLPALLTFAGSLGVFATPNKR